MIPCEASNDAHRRIESTEGSAGRFERKITPWKGNSMKRRQTYAVVLAAGLLTALGSADAVADTPTTTTQPTTTTKHVPPPKPTPMSVSPHSGGPGQTVILKVQLDSACPGLHFSTRE
jgi:hypothetical protein